MAFIIQNEGEAIESPVGSGFYPMAGLDRRDLEIIALAAQGQGVVSGCAVTAQGAPNMTVAVAAGVVHTGAIHREVTAGNVTIAAAHATLPRIDLIVADSAGAKQRRAGTAAALPVFPALTAGDVVLAAVLVQPAVTTITSAPIIDKRAMVTDSIPLLGSVEVGLFASAPSGRLLIDGATGYTKTTYSEFYKQWGPAGRNVLLNTGGSTFDMPDWRQRVPLYKAASGTGSGALGSFLGALQDTISDHPGHFHTGSSSNIGAPNSAAVDRVPGSAGTAAGGHGHNAPTITVGTSADQAHDAIDIVQPSVVIAMAVKV